MILCHGFFSALFVFQVTCLKPKGCDPSTNDLFREGILGQISMFPWLGVIRVELHEGDSVRIALTGAVLIKEKYALTIADDIARMPRRIFERNSNALFIPNDKEPWLCMLKNYTTHPEYPAIMNSIAIIELELEDIGPVPLVPICWPTYPYLYNSSSQLYVLGITDVNDILEKEAYKVKHVRPTQCIQWYNREGLITGNDRWRDYQCVSTENNKRKCLYETGMVLASNATGIWTLLGFGVHGPGCASPSRFIDIYKYIPWIESTTSDVRFRGRLGKQGLRQGFGSGDEVPIHKLFRSNDEKEVNVSSRVTPWIFDRYESGLVPEIVRLDQDAIAIFNNKYEMEKGDCKRLSKLIYTDSVKLQADLQTGTAHYQLSLMDLSVFNYSCIFVRVDSKRRTKAKLWYNYGSFIDTLEGVDETPKRVVKKYPKPERTTAEPKEQNDPTTTAQPSRRLGRRKINKNRRYKKLVSDSLINDLLAIKSELEATREELNITGKADINKTFKKIFAVKEKLQNVRDKLGSPVPDSLKDSINILDKAGSELRAGKVFYQGKLVNVKKQEVQQSIDLIKKLREQPEDTEIELPADKKVNVEETIKKPEARGRQGKKKPWKPHKLLEPEYITDKPGWWLYHPHLNLELSFDFDGEAELMLEIWSRHIKKSRNTPKPKTKPNRVRNITEYEEGKFSNIGAKALYLRLDSDSNTHSEAQRAQYEVRRTDLIHDEQTNESNVFRLKRFYVIAEVLCIFMCNLLLVSVL